MNKILYVMIGAMILLSCGPASKLKRAERLIDKAEKQGAKWHTDTIVQEVVTIRPVIRVDSIFKDIPGQTVTIEKERLKVVYRKLPGDTVFIEATVKGDTIVKEVPMYINRTLKAESGVQWWKLIIFFVLVVCGLLFVKYLND